LIGRADWVAEAAALVVVLISSQNGKSSSLAGKAEARVTRIATDLIKYIFSVSIKGIPCLFILGRGRYSVDDTSIFGGQINSSPDRLRREPVSEWDVEETKIIQLVRLKVGFKSILLY
jgi:hypothetical protein